MFTVILPFNTTLTFSNSYSNWNDSFFVCCKTGDKIQIKYKKRNSRVNVTFYPPSYETMVHSVDRSFSYEEWEKFKKEWNFTKS